MESRPLALRACARGAKWLHPGGQVYDQPRLYACFTLCWETVGAPGAALGAAAECGRPLPPCMEKEV
jgi:hypothetical protein